VFDDPNLVSAAGLVPVLRLAQTAGLHELLGEQLSVVSPNSAVKAVGVIAGMLTGADTIAALDVLRHGGMSRLFTGVRAPSTYGSFLRSFTFGHVRQLDAINSRLLAGLNRLVPGLLPTNRTELALVDLDDTVCPVHGYAKQGARYGRHKGVKGLNLALATISASGRSPVIAAARLRAGNATSAKGAAGLVTDAIRAARAAGVHGRVLVRADGGYYASSLAHAATDAGAWFSLTVKLGPSIRRAIAGIDADAWTTISYPKAIFDEHQQRWISDAEVAETNFIAFTRKPINCRLIVRRVRRLNPAPGTDGTSQDPLFDTWRYHGFITNTDLDPIKADTLHRDHAIIEQVHAELKNAALTHMPCGKYAANAAWTALAIIAFNLARAANTAAGWAHTRWATLRRRLINIPARIATSGRQTRLHLPQQWPWATAYNQLWLATRPPPTTATNN